MHKFKTINQARLLARKSIRINTIKWLEAAAEDGFTKDKNILDLKKTAFFSVNVVARKEEKSTPETNPYVLNFLKKTNWKPNKLSVFAGKVDYPNYNFFNKIVIRFIMMITKGPTDINNSYEFTNWENVR